MKKLSVERVEKIFISENNRQFEALHDVSFTADDGEFTCIIGPTGCGKTTLLRLIAGLVPLSDGRILIDDQAVNGLNRHCTMVFQQFSLFPWMSVFGNLAFALEAKGIARSEHRRRALVLLELVGLADSIDAKPYELSGGMQQRVAIARALAADPAILLMDEPFGALDERTRQMLQDVMLDLRHEKRKLALFVTHNIDEAIYLADRIIVMASEPGRVSEEIAISLPRPRNRLSAEFTELHVKIRNLLEISF